MRPNTKGFFVPARLEEARNARVLTQAEVARRLGRSGGSTISNWERGEQTPEPAALEKLAEALGVSPAYLVRPVPEYGTGAIFFRSLAGAAAKMRARERARVRWLQHISLALQEMVDFPALDLPNLVDVGDYRRLSDADLENIAGEVRRHWRLGDGPIHSMGLVAENAGVVVGVDEVGSTKIDGQANWSEVDGRPYILLARDKNTAYRRQMDTAHELAHIILHRNLSENDLSENFDLIEHQAKYLASAILLPQKSFTAEITSLSLDGFLAMKPRWRVAIGAMIMRSYNLNLISDDYKQRLWKYMSVRGWRQREPLDAPNETPVEEPRLLRRSIELIIDSRTRPARDLVETEIGLAAADIEMMTCLPTGFLTELTAPSAPAEPRLKASANTDEPSSSTVIPFRPRR